MNRSEQAEDLTTYLNEFQGESIAQRVQSEGYFTMRECARRAGVSYCTMKKYVKQGLVFPRIETS